jgi:hypothetical protein
MSVWEVRSIIKNGDRFWQNVWHLEINANTDVPPAIIDAFIAFGRNTLLDNFVLERIVRRPFPSTDEFIEVAVELPGLLTGSSGFTLPLFNIVRVLLTGGAGRPGLKMLRGALLAADIIDDNFTISDTKLETINLKLIDLFNAVNEASCAIVFGSADHVATTAVVQPEVHMRQQHRKRRKSLLLAR